MRQQRNLILLALTLGLALSTTSSSALAACGKFTVVKGDVKVDLVAREGLKAKTESARVGSEICAGDTVKAGPDSRAKIVMIDSNELNISPDSSLIFEKYEYKPEEGKKKVMLNVLYGKVRSTVNQHYDDKSNDGQANAFQVKTKAVVAGVRGTDFITSYDNKTGKAEVITFRGRVEVGQLGVGGKINNSVFVTAGQKTEAGAGQNPATPHAVPASDLKQMNNESKADSGASASTKGKADGGAASSATAKSDDSSSSSSKSADAAAASSSSTTASNSSSNSNSGATTSTGDSRAPASDSSSQALTPTTQATSGSQQGSAPAEPLAAAPPPPPPPAVPAPPPVATNISSIIKAIPTPPPVLKKTTSKINIHFTGG